MKTFNTVILCLALAVAKTDLQAEQNAANHDTDAANVPTQTPCRIADVGANHRVWQWETFEKSPDGQNIAHQHSYTELEMGMNHLVNGEWIPSKEEMDILADGTAAVTNCQYQAYFPGDLYDGAITVITPDGQVLKSRPTILVYTDGNDIKPIGELASSVGQLVASNVLVYPNAFTGISADVRYTSIKGGIEQDIVFHEQLPLPAALGMDPEKTRIEAMTEFFDAPEPELGSGIVDAENAMQDTDIRFGSMRMGPGKAFTAGDARHNVAEGAAVFKDWLNVSGRTFLVEKLPYKSIARQFDNLPLHASTYKPDDSMKVAVSTKPSNFSLPASHPISTSKQRVSFAKTQQHSTGVVLDYVMLGFVATNFTFQGDTTYLMGSSYFEIDGTATFEGGTVIKFPSTTAGFSLASGSTVVCATAPYRPAILTSKDDNSVGETISGSTGTPSGYYGNGITVQNSGPVVFHDIRLSYLNYGFVMYTSYAEFDNLQAVNCYIPIIHAWCPAAINNGLFYNIGGVAVNSAGSGTVSVSGTQLTIDNCQTFADSGTPSLALTNCLVTATTNLLAGSGTLSTNHVTVLSSRSGVFQVAGAGSHYLASGSLYHRAGTSNINSSVLASLTNLTTYPPIIYSNTTIASATTFSPQAIRDTNSSPDLGYHYYPLDYVFGATAATSNLTFTAATAAGWFYNSSGGTYGIAMGDSATASFNGTVTEPCHWARYNTVQESVNGNWMPQSWLGGITGQSYSHAAPGMTANYTMFSSPATEAGPYRDDWTLFVFVGNNCEFYGAGGGGYYASVNATNCLYVNGGTGLFWNYGAANLTLDNCTFRRGNLLADNTSGGAWPVSIVNCAFDSTTFYMNSHGGPTNGYYTDYNSFLVNSNTTLYLGGHEVFVTNSYNWQTGPLGAYYLPANSPLINAGSINANMLGLYCFTTQTNQTPEANSTVDIGYHYFVPGCTTNCGCSNIVVTAASDSFIDVSNAMLQAGAGGTVILPGGTNVWAEPLIDVGVSLLASNKASILFATNVGNGSYGIYIQANGNFVTISNFVFDVDQVNGPERAVLAIDGSNVCYRITHCLFLNASAPGAGTCFGIQSGSANPVQTAGPFGLIDNCNFYFPGGNVYNFVNCKCNGTQSNNAPSAAYTWSQPMSWGTTNVVCIENCNFNMATVTGSTGLAEGMSAARICIRYCNITNCEQSTHGIDSGDQVSTLQVEFYHNNIYENNQIDLPYAFWQRGGSCVVFSNTIGAAGPFMLGSAWYLTTECAVTNESVSGCVTNYIYPRDYPAPEQIGQGVVNGNQGSQPCYFWSNNVSGESYLFAIGWSGGLGDAAFMQQGRDYFTNSVMPGYIPLIYPHPLDH
jgi:hypothetical protein